MSHSINRFIKRNRKKGNYYFLNIFNRISTLKNCRQKKLLDSKMRIAFENLNSILIFGTKNALFRWFGQQFWRAILIFSINAPEFTLFQSLVQKVKILKFGTKNARFPYFRLEFDNIIVIFEISILEFLLSLCLVQKKNP